MGKRRSGKTRRMLRDAVKKLVEEKVTVYVLAANPLHARQLYDTLFHLYEGQFIFKPTDQTIFDNRSGCFLKII